MKTFLIIVGISLAVVIGIIAFIFWDSSTRRVQREHITDFVREVATRCKNGGFYRFDAEDSETWFSIERVAGDDESARLVLRIPRQERTTSIEDQLRETFLTHGFDWEVENDNPSLLAKVCFDIDDIWSTSSGARGAHAVRIFLDALGIPQRTRFKLEPGGGTSWRWRERMKAGKRFH